jgi:hypothetical protein
MSPRPLSPENASGTPNIAIFKLNETRRIALANAYKGQGLGVKTYVDPAYGGEQLKSQTSVMVTLGRQLSNRYSRKDIGTFSSPKAEYIAACKAVKSAS